MVETKRHGDAFDYYYSLGAKRNYTAVAGRFGVGKRTVEKWASAFNWQERVIQRDLEINKRVEEKTNDAVVNTKADYRRDIHLTLQPVNTTINTVLVKNKETGKLECNLEIKSAKDFSLIVGALEKLIKLDLVLMGEADSRTDHGAVIRVHGVDMAEFPAPYIVEKENEDAS